MDDLRVAVVALGKVGLPLAVTYARRASVIGCDIDQAVVGAINEGACPIQGEEGLPGLLAQVRGAGKLRATTDTTAAVAESNVVVIIVPVGIDATHQVDFRSLDAAAKSVAAGLQPGTLVILESTVPVGTTRGRLGRILAAESRLTLDDFHLAFSPERVSSGRIFRDLATYPKVVGGVDPPSSAAAVAFYRRVLDADVIIVPDVETAEFTKLAETSYRDVNIALANELGRAAEALGIDYAIAAKAANSQPLSHLHSPGLGVGGHCIPVYPYFLLGQNPDLQLVTVSRQINDGMAAHGADRLAEALGGPLTGSTVLILGLAYRGGVKESALSSTLLLASELESRGARVLVHDPLFSAAEIAALGLAPSTLPPSQKIDAAVLQAAHHEYRDLDFTMLAGCRVFLDGRGAADQQRVEAAGLKYIAIGQGPREGRRQE